jgi:hypothetical protein
MAQLHIDELVATCRRTPCGHDEVLDESIQLDIAQHRYRAVHAAVEDGMIPGGERRGPIRCIRLGKTSGVGQLQADVEVAVGVRAEPFPVCPDELVAQRRDGCLIGRRKQQLVRARAAIVAHSNGLAAPDELCATAAEALPAAPRVLGRRAFTGSVPALHRQHAEPVADARAVNVDRRAER